MFVSLFYIIFDINVLFLFVDKLSF